MLCAGAVDRFRPWPENARAYTSVTLDSFKLSSVSFEKTFDINTSFITKGV